MENQLYRFNVNVGLIVFGFASAFSGMLIQIKYHIGSHGDVATGDSVLGINYPGWSAVHKFSIVAMTLLAICHIAQHWNWYKSVVAKRLFSKNRQVLVFTVLFVLVAITGLTPWFIDLTDGDEMLRKAFIEIHDKLALIMSVYLVLHIFKRFKWFVSAFGKLKNDRRTYKAEQPFDDIV
ncbi:hypothetical protein SDC9_51355 [bioreactor metagenome]|uniref:Flavinylation-associated cytochrome domain-containing protein n=1 Tax=bioreactor metagenome TaxID=1076179 RepID=A0A644WNH5_9ZZZZ